jgi:hypothetical protein
MPEDPLMTAHDWLILVYQLKVLASSCPADCYKTRSPVLKQMLTLIYLPSPQYADSGQLGVGASITRGGL